MEQFSLEKYLENPSRKVVTRRGNSVRIICSDRKHGEDSLPVVFLENCNGGEFLLACRADGTCDDYDTPYDLFFADEEEELIEIPFGAFDSEFVKDEYLIPEGCEARIEGNKVIIEKIQKEEELTEFEKALDVFAYNSKLGTSNPNYYDWLLKSTALNLLDLARKEIRKEQKEKLGTLEMPIDVTEPYYIKGREDALKSLPKWKKMPNGIQGNGDFNPTYLVRVSNGYYFTTPGLSWDKDSMYIELSELEKLPKEE